MAIAGLAAPIVAPGKPMRLALLESRYRHLPVLATALVILFLRRPDAFFNPQFWAEDGIEFYQRAFNEGPAALGAPYASYLHALPRLVAALAVALDPRWAPALFVGVACAFTLYVAARVLSARCPLPLPAACALAVVLVPDTGEVLLNLVNLQWIAAAGFLLLLISADARRWWQHPHDGAAALLLGLTGPFSVLFAPLFAWRAWARRTRASVGLAAVVALAAAVQARTIWRHPPGAENQPIATDALLAVPGMRIAGSLLLGRFVPMDFARPVETLLGVFTLAATAALALRPGPKRLERTWLALALAALLASALFRCRYVLPHLCHATYGSRYFYPLQLIALWLLLAATADDRRWLARAAAGLACWSLAVNAPRLREGPLPDLRWADYAPKIRAGEAVSVPINPAPWKIDLPARKP